MAVSVAILYAGRWFGRAGQLSMTPRLSHVLHALPVSVFLVSPDQWCATAGADDEVAQMFGPGVTTQLCVGPQLCPSRLQYGKVSAGPAPSAKPGHLMM